MGCSASRRAVANEDTVRRCRDRRRLMSSAVTSHRRLSASHSRYLCSLRRAAAALSRFASLHSLPISDETPPVFLSSAAPTAPPPPPPPSFFSPPPPPPPKSSLTLPSTFLPAPGSCSSPWNWEEFYPPSPPASDLYASSDESERSGVQVEKEGKAEGEEDRCSLSTGTSSGSEGGCFEHRELSDGRSKVEIWRREEDEEASLVVVVRHRSFKEIAAAIEEQLLKAAAAGEAAAGLLETGGHRLDRGRLKGTLSRSTRMLRTLSSTWSSRESFVVRYKVEDGEWEKSGSHFSTLDKLFSLEKKLYEEVKARESAKFEYGRKMSALESQEKRGANATKLDKTKAVIQRLQSRILEMSSAVLTTSSTIIKARDDELAPQLIELCNRFLQMWRSMNQCHEVQTQIVQQVSGLVKQSTTFQSSDLHLKATYELKSAIADWHLSFVNLIKFQRSYIHSLHNWLKLTLLQVSNERPERDHYSCLISSELTAFCGEWKQAVDKLPDASAAEAIHSFTNIMHSISSRQKDELRIKKRVEAYSKELEKKKFDLFNTERKYYRSYSMVGIGFGLEDNENAFDSKDTLVKKKVEVTTCSQKLKDETKKHTRAVWATREITLENIKRGLPGLFQELAIFSGNFAEALEDVCCRRIGQWF